MARLDRETMESLKKKYDVDRLWSFSRWNTYMEHKWLYRIKYIEKKKVGNNIYGHFGTICHDIIQGLYDGEHTYEEMPMLFNIAKSEWEADNKGMLFPTEKSGKNYFAALEHYFENTVVEPYKIVNEQPVIFTDKYPNGDNMVFIGYVDSMYQDDEGITHLVDYKTSSKAGFTGKKLKESSRQLQLYALAISQYFNIPLEKINLRFDMMKYVEVEYLQKNGKWSSSKQQRNEWVEKSSKKIEKALLDIGYDVFEIEDMIVEASNDNSLESLPTEVQERFRVKNWYVDVPVDVEEANKFKQHLLDTTLECMELEQSGDIEKAFPEPKLTPENSFFYTQLSGAMSYHQGYQDSLEVGSTSDEITIDELEELLK